MKVAIITGAANGIGLALSEIYLHRGVKVMMIDKNHTKLKAETEKYSANYPEQVLSMVCDISDESAVKELAKESYSRLGRVDWLYNNAGIIGEFAPVWDLEVHSMHELMEVNLFSMVYMIQAFCPLLFQQTFESQIINMASLYALCSGSQLSAYAISKHAVLALSESLYFDLKRLNKAIDVSIAFPSFTDTALLSEPANNSYAGSLKFLLSHAKKATEVAEHIVSEVDKKRFYILPDKEVKNYCEERAQSIIMQENPHMHNIEKLMNSLIKRNSMQ